MLLTFKNKELKINSSFYSIQADIADPIVRFCELWLNGLESFVVATSGSTGVPKEINITRYQALESVKLTQEAFTLNPSYTALLCLDFNTIAGKMMLIRSIELEMNLYVMPPSRNPLLDFPSHINIDFVALAPLQLDTILNNSATRNKLIKFRNVLIGGASVNDRLLENIKSIKVPIYHSYGMTETVSHIALKLLNTPKAYQYFQALKNVELSIDARSCLVIKASVTNHQEIVTNDLVNLYSDSEFEIVGRIDNVINSGGVKIIPEEIEKLIASLIPYPFFVYGQYHTSLGQELVLCIETSELDCFQKEQILQSVKVVCPKYKNPKRIVCIPKFRYTLSNKIDRKLTVRM